LEKFIINKLCLPAGDDTSTINSYCNTGLMPPVISMQQECKMKFLQSFAATFILNCKWLIVNYCKTCDEISLDSPSINQLVSTCTYILI